MGTTAYVCDSAATRPSSQITLGRLVRSGHIARRCNSVFVSSVTKSGHRVDKLQFKMLHDVWSLGLGNMSVRGLSRLMHDDLHWLIIPCCDSSSLSSAPSSLASRRLLCATSELAGRHGSTRDLSDIINCRFR